MNWLDNSVAACLVPLAVWVLLSGLDDLVLDLACVYRWLRGRFSGGGAVCRLGRAELEAAAEKRVAVFVPLWREHQVIGRMLEHNLAAVNYRNYDFFLGAYPNDLSTLEAVREAKARFPRVHMVVCPHDGPTSKGDCLNWIFQGMLVFEEERGERFEVVVLHDAEDLIHPESLRWINRLADAYDMIQIPVLPLATPWRQLTHGVYCDEFAEFQSRDLFVRRMLKGFLPSNGVGTGYSRGALEKLAATAVNRVFDPGCLTEDYEVGLRLSSLGCRQIFVPIRFLNGHPLATRELFPHRFADALRQRTRWVIGIALQSWAKYGWGGSLAELYWFWRDRKGLIGNPGSLLINLLFVYGAATGAGSLMAAREWALARAAAGYVSGWVFHATLALLCLRVGVRAGCVARIYGWRFALGVPVRSLWANWINSAATVSAVARYWRARARRRPLVWLKTEHQYPSRAALMCHKRRLGEILVGSGYLAEEQVDSALNSKPPYRRLGEHLIGMGLLREETVYEALSLQQNLPYERLGPDEIQRSAAQVLPAEVARHWKLLPFHLEAGRLHVAGPELPCEEAERELRALTRLDLRFHLITPGNLEELARLFL